MRFSFFMALMTLVLSFALFGQVEAKSRRLNKRRLSLERRGNAAAGTGPNLASNNIITPTTQANAMLANLSASIAGVNSFSNQATNAIGPGGTVSQASAGLGSTAAVANGVLAPAPPG
ncbi:hypothetical protein INT47_002248 [Mucor saturninus]|uniref:Uncharacterized protein n=1 Tax=Mucor saturninus TaxID=64648 RepID=A0A8H7R5V7_9FUNG|nr:hypothetical protein INT47_002248 [Mucor saturninus]